MNLLMVDDEIVTIKGILRGIKWEQLSFDEVRHATSSGEAKEIFQTTDIDIILCDIEMPDENGIKLLEWIREHNYETECIFLTCHDEFDFARNALKLKGMDYLLKPIPYSELQEILKKAIDKIKEKQISIQYEKYGKNQLEQIKKIAEENDTKPNGKVIVEKIKQYISDHLQDELSAEMLAKQVYVSTDYLFYLFKKEETTLVEYITNVRMFYAAELLKDSSLSIGRVAMSVGYSNYCYFSKVFKKAYGITPSQYQREFKNCAKKDIVV